VILSIGVRPNSELARESRLELNARGGIIVDSKLELPIQISMQSGCH
jgi:NAD(P)H-nitrite reductase large subunit